MTKSLADLRANPPQSRPERSMTICLAPHLVAEVEALTAELSSLPTLQRTSDESPDAPPRKMAEGPHPRKAEIQDRLRALVEEMGDLEGELRLRATTDGEWRRWVNDHPPRVEGDPGHQRDTEVTGGYCNADDLIDDLGTYAYSWNGETLAPDDWSWLVNNMGGPDLKQAATAVVAMHESRLDFRQWRSALSASLNRSSASVSPARSASAPDASTAGSPEPSSTASTETATA